MDWNDEPATRQQLLLLQEYGFATNRALSITEAARIIRQYKRNPPRQGMTGPIPVPAPAPAAAPVAKAPLHPYATPARMAGSPVRRVADLSESARIHAHALRADVEKAKGALAQNPDGPNIRADFISSTKMRKEFWRDTCRDAKEMQIGSVQVFEFYQNYGARFFTPTGEQVQEVLDALDRGMPEWDRDHPELFYQTLELNFPALLRYRQNL